MRPFGILQKLHHRAQPNLTTGKSAVKLLFDVGRRSTSGSDEPFGQRYGEFVLFPDNSGIRALINRFDQCIDRQGNFGANGITRPNNGKRCARQFGSLLQQGIVFCETRAEQQFQDQSGRGQFGIHRNASLSSRPYRTGITEMQPKGAPKFSNDNAWNWSDAARTRSVNDYYGAAI
jgi:hypothetical protein